MLGLAAQGGGAVPHPQSASAATAAAVKPAAAPAAGQARSQITLVTGEQVRISSAGGQPAVSVRPAMTSQHQAAGNMAVTFSMHGDIYAVPSEALPYLGSVLDPSLFDVSYLQRAGYAGLATLPVTVTWKNTSHSAVPGITAATTGQKTAGTIGLQSGGIGQLLAKSAQSRASLSQISRISLAPLPASSTPASSTPAAGTPAGGAAGQQATSAAPLTSAPGQGKAKLYTLTASVLDHAGAVADGWVWIQNLDNLQDYYSVASTAPGQPAVVNVPAGRYAIEGVSYDTDSLGDVTNVALVPGQVTVGSDTTLTLDARPAVPISVTVPAADAAAAWGVMTFARTSVTGGALNGGVDVFGQGFLSTLDPVQMYVVPTAAPKDGSLGFADSWLLEPAGDGGPQPAADAPYNYNLDFASADGIPADETHVLTAADLATEQDGFAAPATGDSQVTFATPFHSWAQFAFQMPSTLWPFPAPATRTDYFGGSSSTIWQMASELIESPWSDPVTVAQPLGPMQTFRPGEQTSVTWGGVPAVPGPTWQDTGVPNPTTEGYIGTNPAVYDICPVCRQGNLLSFNAQLAGNDPAQTDLLFGLGSGIVAARGGGPQDSLEFYRNGALTQESGYSGQVYPLLPGKASYEIDWSHTADPAWSDLGTTVDSDWTFTSAPASPQRMPSYEYCSPDPAVACSFVPLIFASYDFGDGLTGQVPAGGTRTFTLTAYHEANDDGPPVTGATVQVSFDGKTWTPATVTSLGHGTYRVTVTQPASSGYASVKVSLTDAAGDTLRQTIIHAYALTAASGSSAER